MWDLRPALKFAGFQPVSQLDSYEIWCSENTSGMVQAIPQNRILLYGETLGPMLNLFPFAEEAQIGVNLDQIDLPSYPLIALYNFAGEGEDLIASSSFLSEYVNQGGSILVDLSGMEDLLGGTREFLGVTALRIVLDDQISIRWEDQEQNLSNNLPLMESWAGAVYEGLDVVLADARFEESWFPILGYKNVGKGKVWFLGLNLSYYLQLQNEPEVETYIRELVLSEVAYSPALEFDAIDYQNWAADSHNVYFQSSSREHVSEALISYTYSPRWQATIDGKPAPISSFENLIKLEIPPGDHTVEISYHPFGTSIAQFAVAIPFLTISLLTISLAYSRFRRKRFPVIDPDHQMIYHPCANCGFVLAVVSIEIDTHNVQHECPICGFQQLTTGTQPGKELSSDERSELLGQWLRSHRYDPKIVYERWGFSPDSFFIDTDSSSADNH
jgi:predicted RNA-binding Zn-ribbon protein involved in translation (DUF1610 family)